MFIKKYTIKNPINIANPPQSGVSLLCFFLFVGLSVKLYLLDNFINSEVVSMDIDETLLNYSNNMLGKDYKGRVTFINDDITDS